jgi:hypothetical protein
MPLQTTVTHCRFSRFLTLPGAWTAFPQNWFVSAWGLSRAILSIVANGGGLGAADYALASRSNLRWLPVPATKSNRDANVASKSRPKRAAFAVPAHKSTSRPGDAEDFS